MFATILELASFRKVNYYTIQIEGEAKDLFEDFVDRHEKDCKEELDVIQSWLKKIGDEIGARDDMFRFEAYRGGDARGLPPPAKFLETKINLRLYCMRIDKHNVILFNGGIKTKAIAQDCDNVRPHFLMANKISKAIQESIIEKSIVVNPKTRKLDVDDNFELEIL